MAPSKQRKRKSSASTTTTFEAEKDNMANVSIQESVMGAQSSKTAIHAGQTPAKGSTKQRPLLTAAQKQALIDNLQLEITERARKLRAQYALQAQGLKTRLEIRVHRIPVGLRKVKVSELLEQHSQPGSSSPQKVGASERLRDFVATKETVSGNVSTKAAPARGTKRTSDEIADDKENESLGNAKKRTKAAPGQASKQAPAQQRTTSRRDHPSQVLSPKSNNSRPLPRSPMKPTAIPSPMKPTSVRPVSPLKPSTATRQVTSTFSKPSAPASKPKTTAPRTASKQAETKGNSAATRAKRTVVTQSVTSAPSIRDKARTSIASDATDTSAGTTVVKKRAASRTAPSVAGARAATKAATAGKFAGVSAAGKKVAASKAEPASNGTVKGGRTLRKRA